MRSACSAGPAKAGAATWARRLKATAVATPAERRASRDRAVSEGTPTGGELPFPTICILIAPPTPKLSMRGHTLRPESPAPVCLSRQTSPDADIFVVGPAAGLITRQSASRVTAAADSSG